MGKILKTRFPEWELETLRRLATLFTGRAAILKRWYDGSIYLEVAGLSHVWLNDSAFPQLKPGEYVLLDEVDGPYAPVHSP